MKKVTLREPTIADQDAFIAAMQASQDLHLPWVASPITAEEFRAYLTQFQQVNQKSFLACDHIGNIVGVFNISEIVTGLFQSAYLGFYVVAEFAGQGYMNAGLKQLLAYLFNELKLHRIEANIQPDNTSSINLVKANGFRYEGFSPRYLKINGHWCGHEHWAMTYEDYVKDDPEVLKKDYIDIVPYDKEWPIKAKAEIAKLQMVLPASSISDIQHIGSTAIPGMAAKPILDIQIAAYSLNEMRAIAVPALMKLGYEFWYENPDLDRLFFVKGMPPYGAKRSHHVHIFESSSKRWRERLKFRDYLISHPKAAKEYEALKLALANQFLYDREAYTNAKSDFINRII